MKNNKGFTLGELLIVAAILAILVSVVMPVFADKLEAAKEAADISNMRTAYGLAATMLVSGEFDEKTVYYFDGAELTLDPPEKGYGKGTTREGSKMEFQNYNAASDVKGMYIAVHVEGVEILLDWVS